MRKKIMIGCILSVIIILFSSSDALDIDIDENISKKVKYLAVGFFPETRGEWIVYYLIPNIIWAQVHQNDLTIIWLGTFFIIGISSIRPDYGFGKIP